MDDNITYLYEYEEYEYYDDIEDYSETFDIQYFIPYWRQMMWISIFSVITVVGTIGNCTIIWIVLAHKNMRTAINLFVVNLAIADGLVTSFVVPFESFQFIYGYWPFGSVMCKIHEIFSTTNTGVSILTLSMISLNRYRAIMYPFKGHTTKELNIMIMIGIWLASILILSPNWIYITHLENKINNAVLRNCLQIWPDKNLEDIFRYCMLVILYFLPLTCLGFSYGSMAVKLWGHKTIGEHSQSHVKKKRDKKRIVKMLIVIVITFAICWLPFQLMFIIKRTKLFHLHHNTVTEISLATFGLAMSNSMFNPTICCLMNARFRAGFKKAFRWCPCIRYDPVLDNMHFSNMRMSTETE